MPIDLREPWIGHGVSGRELRLKGEETLKMDPGSGSF